MIFLSIIIIALIPLIVTSLVYSKKKYPNLIDIVPTEVLHKSKFVKNDTRHAKD